MKTSLTAVLFSCLLSFSFLIKNIFSSEESSAISEDNLTNSFTCTPEIPEYSEKFFVWLPTCWEEAGGGSPSSGPAQSNTNNSWAADGFANAGTSGSARVTIEGTNLNHEWIISPEIDLLNTADQELSFDIALTTTTGNASSNLGSDDYVKVVITSDGGNTWTVIQTWDNTSTISNTRETHFIDLAPYAGSIIQIGFVAEDGSINDPEDIDFFIDNFLITNCGPPSSLTAIPTTSSVQINWVENGSATLWDIEIVPFGNPPTGVPTVSGVNSNSYTWSGVFGEYDFYVRSQCDANINSQWAGPLTFSPLISGGYCEDFSPYLPIGWKEGNGGSLLTGPDDFEDSAWYGSTSANRAVVQFNQLDKDWLISPQMILSAPYGTVEFKIDLWIGQIPPSGSFVKLLITDDGGITWTTLETWDNNSYIPTLGEYHSVDISSYLNSIIQLAFVADNMSNNSNYFLLSDFCIPLCSSPSDINITPTNSGADISWTSVNSISMWDIEFVPFGSSPTGIPTVENIMSNPYTWTGGNSNTIYDVYIRSDCNSNGTGNWIRSSFTTFCGGTLPYSQQFQVTASSANSNPLGCWYEGNGGTTSSGPALINNSSWGSRKFGNNTNNSLSQRIIIEETNLNNEWLISEEILINSSIPLLRFNIALTEHNNTNASNFGSDDFVGLLITTDGGSTWQVLDFWDESTPISNTGQFQTYDLSSYFNMIVQFAFIADDGVIDDPEDINFFVDDFIISDEITIFSEDFSTYLPTGWTEAPSGTVATGPIYNGNQTAGFWREDGFANIGFTGAAGIRLYRSLGGGPDWLVSPNIDLTNIGIFNVSFLEFKIALTYRNFNTPSNMGELDYVHCVITADNGATWQILETWDMTTPISNTGDFYSIDLSAFANSIVKIAFMAHDGIQGIQGGTADVDFFVDDITITNTCSFDSYYPDMDGDGNGDASSLGTSFCIGNEPPNWVTNNDDCNDNDPNDNIINVDNNPIPIGLYYANDTIYSVGTVELGTVGVDTVVFQAGGGIILKPGFAALTGSDWHAYLDDECPPSTVPFVSNEPTSDFIQEKRITNQIENKEIQLSISPNPTSSNTIIEFGLEEASKLNVQVYDINGQLMATLLENKIIEAGIHRINYDTENLKPGVYYVFMSTEDRIANERLIIIR